MAQDYLARIKWEGEHPYMGDGSKPDIPNWKYKPTRPNRSPMSAASRIITTIVLVIVFGGLLYLAIFEQESGVICLTGLLVFMGLFVFLLKLDASNPKRRE